MSRYAFDPHHNALIVSWPTGSGDIAATLAPLPPTTAPGQAQALARKLTDLSHILWRTYTHPPAAAHSTEPNGEGWRRQHERDNLASVPSAITDPNLPSNGRIIQSYVPSQEQAHRVGRALHTINDASLTAAISTEVKAELTAIEQAERGDLSGRAIQAIALSRAGASPVQVEAADRLLRSHPLGGEKLFTGVDPAAAAVAAAHWLQAAADITSEVCDLPAADIVVESDNIHALPHQTPTHVLTMLEAGLRPYEIVTSLIGEAMTAAEGTIPDPDELREGFTEAEEMAQQHSDDPNLRHALLASVRTTPLDPIRPAPDLLEDLLAGIEGCATLFHEYADQLDEAFGGPIGLPESDPDDDEVDQEEWEAYTQEIHKRFVALVRVEAENNRERLL